LVYFIFGKIFYAVAKFDPIDLEDLNAGALSVSSKGATLASIMYLVQSLFVMQSQINTGSLTSFDQAPFDVIQQYEMENNRLNLE
jgi:hypothetical protein